MKAGDLARGPAFGFKIDEKAVDAAVDFQNGDALGLGRVGGHRRGDRQAGDGGLHRLGRQLRRADLGEGRGKGSRHGIGAVQGLGPSARAHGGILVGDLLQLEPDIDRLKPGDRARAGRIGGQWGRCGPARAGIEKMRHLGCPPRDDLVQKAEEQGAQGGRLGVVCQIGCQIGCQIWRRVAIRSCGGLEGVSGGLHRHALLPSGACPRAGARRLPGARIGRPETKRIAEPVISGFLPAADPSGRPRNFIS